MFTALSPTADYSIVEPNAIQNGFIPNYRQKGEGDARKPQGFSGGVSWACRIISYLHRSH